MNETVNTALERRRSADAELLDVQCVASMLNCSIRHVYRMTDEGRLPTPVKLGALVRWPRADMMRWIAAGCPRQIGGAQ